MFQCTQHGFSCAYYVASGFVNFMTGQVLVIAVLNGRAKVTKACLREVILLEVCCYCDANRPGAMMTQAIGNGNAFM